MTTQEVRKKYFDFYKRKNHKIISSSSLIPENDPSLLFTNSGMFPLVPYLLGEQDHPSGKLLANSQKCFRSEDIDEVGDGRHNTFFEMLGNWSLGDYFKKEQLKWWFEFMIEDLGLDISKIYQTVYLGDGDKIEKDNESIEILKDIYKKYGIEAEEGPETSGRGEDGPGVELDFSKQRIFAYRDKNWWQRGDAVGELGGPDSETFYDTGKEHDKSFGKHCHTNCDCGRFIEIGNSVFMQYQKTATSWEPLKSKNVDFGGGLERLVMAKNGLSNVFKIDSLKTIIEKLEELSSLKYHENKKAFEVIADHIKASTFLLGDDKRLSPSNTDQGYIIRRLIRRALRYLINLDIYKPGLISELSSIIVDFYKDDYSELDRNKDFIASCLRDEEDKFSRTINRGERILSSLALKSETINGKIAFDLFQSHGYPLEMTEEIINEKNINKSENFREEFSEEFKNHQERSKTASAGKFKGGLADQSEETTKLHTAAHLLLASLRIVLGDHVNQRGSNITSERLRFDFSHPEKMTEEQKAEVENLVNKAIEGGYDVVCTEMKLSDARDSGAIGVFDSKYDELVKVYSVADFSKEICGGPHVDSLKGLGTFKIEKEGSSSSGVRRIRATLDNINN